MIAETRDDRIVSAVDLIPWQSMRFPRLPRGIDRDDLESAGQEALIHAATTFDPDAGTPWKSFARVCIRNAMRNVIATARSRRHSPLDIELDDGSLVPRADPRAGDPGEIAAAREMIAAPRAGRRHVTLSNDPDPAAVASRAAAIREAMFAAISAEDAAAIIRQVADKARKGDLKAARLFFDLVSPARTGTTVVQQAVIVHQGDLD